MNSGSYIVDFFLSLFGITFIHYRWALICMSTCAFMCVRMYAYVSVKSMHICALFSNNLWTSDSADSQCTDEQHSSFGLRLLIVTPTTTNSSSTRAKLHRWRVLPSFTVLAKFPQSFAQNNPLSTQRFGNETKCDRERAGEMKDLSNWNGKDV